MKSIFLIQIISMSVTGLMGSSVAFSLPDLSKSLPPAILTKTLQDPELQGAKVLGDHEKDNVFYIGPSTKKIQAGSFRFLDYAANCSALENVFKLTFTVPKVDEEEFSRVARQGSYSPFFDSHFSNSIIYSDILRKLMDSIGSEEKLRQNRAELFSEYEAAKKEHELASASLLKTQAEIAETNTRVQNAANMLAMSRTIEERESAQKVYDQAVLDREAALPGLRDRFQKDLLEESRVRPRYVEAHGKVAPYLVNLQDIENRIRSLKNIYTDLDTISFNAFSRMESTLSKFRARPVGIATASYSLWGNEVARFSKILEESGMNDIQVLPLPIHDVSLDSTEVVTETKTADAQGEGIATEHRYRIVRTGEGERALADKKHPTENPVFKDEKGQPIRPLVATYNQKGAASVAFFVSQGTYCMGQSKAKVKRFDPRDLNKKIVRFEAEEFKLRDSNRLSHSVALNYNYFVKAEPTSVSCKLSISQVNEYIRNAGNSGFLFWRKSWDDTERKLMKDNGLSCEVKESPNLVSEEEKIRWRNETITRMSQEIMAEYTLQFAQKWDVIEKQPVKIPEGSYASIGSLSLLCGVNTYCQIANIVWKTGEVLFGGQAGSTSNKDVLGGTISRSYSESSYRSVPGSSSIELFVDVE
jgi:hypothetical protein